MNILEKKLSRIDLNLLVALSVLLNERSVSKAAKALYISQPAMSKTLQRLRILFDDPLFYRTASGIVPSNKANDLEKLLPHLLDNLNQIFKKTSFDPLTCTETITISVPSVLCYPVLLPFISKLSKLAPNICIVDLPIEADPFTSLTKGKYDFAIHTSKPHNNDINFTPIGTIKPLVYARKSHPLVNSKNKVDLAALAEYKFIYYQIGAEESTSFESPADKVCKRINFNPTIVTRSSHFSMLTALLANNDFLLMSADLLIKSTDFAEKFVPVYQFEVEADESVEILLLEHQRVKDSAAQQWVKQQLIESIAIFKE